MRRGAASNIPQWLIVALILIPYAALALRFPIVSPRFLEVWFSSIQQTLLQALVSTMVLMLLSVPAALGLLGFGRFRSNRLILLSVALPALLPTVVPVSALLQIGTLWGGYPLGWWGVLLAHVALNLGFASVLTVSLIERRCGRWAELAAVEGAGSLMFWRVVTSAVRGDLMVLFCGFFLLFYFSLQVPLLLGGGTFHPVEMVMLEQLRSPEAWSEIWTVSLFHLLAVVILMITVGRVRLVDVPGFVSWKHFRPFWGPTLAALPLPLMLVGVIAGASPFETWPSSAEFPWLETLFTTFLFGMTTGGFVLFFLLCLSWSAPQDSVVYILRSGVVPSLSLWILAMIGLGVLALPAAVGASLVLGLWFLPMLYRWGVQGVEASITSQRQVAEVMGASRWLSFKRIIFPQVILPLSRMSAVAATWACGDYVVAPFFFGDRPPLGEVMAQAMQSHRWNWVPMMLIGILFCSVLCFLVFEVLGHVFGVRARQELR